MTRRLALPLMLSAAMLRGQGARDAATALQRDGDEWSAVETGSFPARGLMNLRVSSIGAVTVTGGGGDRIEYRLIRRARASGEEQARRLASLFELRFDRASAIPTLTLQPAPGWNRTPQLELRVPSTLISTHVFTQTGALTLDRLSGQLTCETGGGPVRAGSIDGALQLTTGGGPVDIRYVAGGLRCLTAGGPIRVQRVDGESWLETGGGDVIVDVAMARVHASTGAGNVEVSRARGNVSARTLAGVIKVYEASGLVNAHTGGGGIQVGSAHGVQCDSVAGGVRLRNVSGPVNVSTAAGSILAEWAGGVRMENSILNSASGDITVVIPARLAVTIQAMNELPGKYGRIVSEFSEIRVLPVVAPVRGPVLAEGALNGGGPVLRVAATRGTIFLRRKE
ncbi:MAG: hypothetical protein IT164_14900 [Bryobacterales bacterium]|nr:hypothetical protein [Bryobacterales bacterium]